MTKKATGAWMKLYLDAFKGGTTHMSAAELGAYTRLLLHGWDKGGIPSDVSRMARIAGMDYAEFEAAWVDVLREKFTPHPDDPKRLVNAKQEDVRGEQEAHVAQRKAAADARWNKGKNAKGMRDECDRKSETGSQEGCGTPCETDEDLGIRDQGLGSRQQASGARARDAAAEPPSEKTPDWVRTAIESIRVQGIPVNPGDRALKELLATDRWAAPDNSEEERLRALAVVVNRAKAKGVSNPRGLLELLLTNESAAEQPTDVAPESVSNTTTGEGSRHWDGDAGVKAKAHRGEAASLRDRASKAACPDGERKHLLAKAMEHDEAAERLEASA